MSPDADPYASIAGWYDLEHDALTDDIALLHELIAERVPARARVLEVGAGTGRIAAGLAMTGMEVTAVEPSTAMRERAAKRLSALPDRVGRRVRLVAGSASDLGIATDERFDAVVLGLGTFAHLTSLRERLEALERARRHLRDNGQLVLDLDLAGLRRLAETAGQLWHQGTWPLPDSGPTSRFVSHFVAAGPLSEGALVPLAHFYDVYDQGGDVTRTLSQMTLAVLSRGEVELSLMHAGYTVEAVFGGYAQEPYEEGASRAIFVATPDSSNSRMKS
jgi:SAM-dependent methyltransferase